MACTKNTARKPSGGLPPARFPLVATGVEERSRHYQAQHKLPVKILQSPAADVEPAVQDDWTQLIPSLPEGAAPPLEHVVERLNQEFDQPPPQDMEELADLVQDLCNNPPAPCELPVDMNMLQPTVISETVAETPQPLLLTKRAVASLAPSKARPNPSTGAAKCPRLEFQQQQRSQPAPRRKSSKPISLTSLQEIRKYQTESKPLLHFLPFTRVVRETLNQQGPYKITRGALMALKEVVEEHIVKVFEGANLACMHRDRGTLAPRDIRLYRHLSGDKDHLGIEPRSQEAKELDWQKFKEGRLTMAEATVLDTERHRKIRAQMRRLRKRALAGAGCL